MAGFTNHFSSNFRRKFRGFTRIFGENSVICRIGKGGRDPITGKKRFKIILATLLSLWLVSLTIVLPAQVALGADVAIYVGGQKVDSDVPPYVDGNNRTMVPIRFVAESLGAEVKWLPNAQRVVVSIPYREIQLNIGQNFVLVNGEQQNIDTVPVVKNGRTMVPLRFVSETLGAKVTWQKDTKIVEIQLLGPQDGVDNGNARSDPDTISRGGDYSRDPTAPKIPLIENVQIQDAITTFIIQAPGVAEPQTSLLQEPRRLVLDFHDVNMMPDSSGQTLEINNRLVARVRTGQFAIDIFRVVVDLKNAAGYSVTEIQPGSYLVKIEPLPLAGKLVVIDPGHASIQPGGWSDPGAVGPRTGIYERDVVLDVGVHVVRLLQDQGVEVILTRNGNTTLSLEDRAKLANNAGASAFVSIHANSSTGPVYNGTSVYYYAPILSALGSQRTQRQQLATSIQRSLVGELGRKDLGIIEQNLSVLRNTTVPSVLVEIAFLSHPEEEWLLGDPAFRLRSAQAIARGITDYLSNNV